MTNQEACVQHRKNALEATKCVVKQLIKNRLYDEMQSQAWIDEGLTHEQLVSNVLGSDGGDWLRAVKFALGTDDIQKVEQVLLEAIGGGDVSGTLSPDPLGC